MPEGFDPEQGTVARAVVTCMHCGSTVDAKTTRLLFQEGKSGERMTAVILLQPGTTGKKYRLATDADIATFRKSAAYLEKKLPILREQWGIEPIPDEQLPVMSGVFNAPIYGLTTWGSLFNKRQQLTLLTFVDVVRNSFNQLQKKNFQLEYVTALMCYFSLAIDRLADKNANVVVWDSSRDMPSHVFGRQALPMVWDYAETNVIDGEGGDWSSAMDWIQRNIEQCSLQSVEPATITNVSSTGLPYPNNFFDAIFTDPPYYYNVPYADLSDFFYVWMKRSISTRFPDLFSTTLTPKKNEIVQMKHWDPVRYPEKDQNWFESNLTKSFQEINRILKPNGIAIIVYAHKSTEGWETLINSLLDSGLIMTGAWPLNTEMGSRLRSHDSAALASSIYIVARKMERQPTGFYNNVKEELKTHLNKKLERLWHEGISGADFFIAAIGSAIEVFGKYEQVMDYEGNVVRADRLLLDVRKIATDYAVRQILHNGFAGEISDFARLYVLWRWNYSEAKVPFDEGRKLGQSCGIDISHEWSHTGFVKKDKEFVRLLGPQERKLEDLEGSKDMIDVLHQVLLLWEKSRRDEMIKVLQETGYGKSEAFYRVAQAISESLPNESKEKKLLEGFTAGRERMTEEVKKEARQARLDV